MINILITGSEGYTGSMILEQLNIVKSYFKMNFRDLDLIIYEIKELNRISIRKYASINFDFIFHCAVFAGRSYELNDQSVYDNNMDLFLNVNKLKFSKLIHFTSGADLDRRLDIHKCNPYEVINRNPIDAFGKVKNDICKIVIDKKLGLNIRIFNLYGHHSIIRNQFIDNILDNLKSDEPFHIQNDRYFDFFNISDLSPVIFKILKNELNEDYNLSYNKKIKISELTNYIFESFGNTKEIIINLKGKNYTGSNTYKIDELEFKDPFKSVNEFLKSQNI